MKQRKPSKKIINRILILCEGKTEYIYFDGIKIEKFNNDRKIGLRIEIGDPQKVKGVGKELVEQAKSYVRYAKSKEDNPYQDVWVVFDKDNYPKHPQAFNQAKDNNINIAFSSISFEYWFLLHFKQTKKPFNAADDLISYLKRNGYPKYEKTLFHYSILKSHTETAIKNAKWLRAQLENEKGTDYKPHECNPYTDVDILVDYLLKLK